MSDVFPKGWDTLKGGQYGVVELTAGEIKAVFAALGECLSATDEEEQRTIFGSTQGAMAGARALDKIKACGGAMGALRG